MSSEIQRATMRTKVEAEGKMGDPITFVISSEAIDRAGDTIAVDGWDLSNFVRNPVVLWMHDHTQLPVGKATSAYVEDGKLKATTVFASDRYAFAETVEALYRGGFLNATSVGFVSSDFDRDDNTRGFRFKTQELREFSCVTIPANPEALIEAKSAGIDLEPMREWASKTLERIDGAGIWVPKAEAERVLRATGGSKTFSIPAAAPMESTVKMTIVRYEVPADKADELTKKAKNLGGMVKDDDSNSGAETAFPSNEDMASHIKALKDCADAHKGVVQMHKDAAAGVLAANETLGSHIKDLADAIKGMKDDDDSADDSKGADASRTKGGAPHKLSKANYKDASAAFKAIKGVLDRHGKDDSADDSSDDDDSADDASKSAAADRVKRLAEIEKRAGEIEMRLTGKVPPKA